MSVIHITSENFQELVTESSKPVLLDFWATWCGPCKMISPIVEEIAAENEEITVGKINIDDEMQLAVQFGITSIPTLVVVKNGTPVATAVGYRSKADILKLLEA